MQLLPSVDISFFTRKEKIFWSGFIAALLLPLLISILSPLPFAMFVPVTGLGFFIAHKICFGTWPWPQVPLPGLTQLLVILIALTFCSALWSIEPVASFERAMKIAPLILCSYLLIGVAAACPPAIWSKLSLLFPFVFFLVGAATCLDVATGMHFYNSFNHASEHVLRPDLLNKNMSVIAMALPPAAYLAWKNRSVPLLVATALVTAATLFLTYSQACQLSILVVLLAAFGCFSFLEKITIRAAFLSLGFFFLMLPWIAPTLFDLLAAKLETKMGIAASASAPERLENWDFLSRRIQENPLNGFGMDTTRYMTFDTQELYFKNNSIMHPHNIILQMWMEFGAFGVAWIIAFMTYFYALLSKVSPNARRLGFLTFCAVMIFLLVSWSIWSSWLVAIILYLAALCVLAVKTSISPSNS